MEKTYWLNRWETGDIRFNEPNPHRFLKKYLNTLCLKNEEKIFVPLCGKSVDMLWLMQHHHYIVGVEISPIAITDFLQENNLDTTKFVEEPFIVYKNKSCILYNGDLFNLTPKYLSDVKAIYDRGCLTALPPKTLRKQYVDWLKATIAPKSKMLLVVFEHNAVDIVQPPFSTSREEVYTCFASHFTITPLEREYITEIKPHWSERAVCDLYECVYLLEKYNS